MARKTVIGGVALAVVIALASMAGAGGRPLATDLSGAEEVPSGVGDDDGTGTASLTLNAGQEEVCYELTWQNLDGTVQNAHIHEERAGANGGVVVPLFLSESFSGASGSDSGCVEGAKDVIQRILRDPSGFYVNIHDSERTGGAIRGQLER